MRYLFVVFCLFALPCEAATLKGGFPACLSIDLLSQEVVAVEQNDRDALGWLLKNGCAVTQVGLHATVLETSPLAIVRVRVYRGGNAVEVWTPIEAVAE